MYECIPYFHCTYTKAIMQSWSVSSSCAIVQEDRKRRFFMLDEIRIAEGEGKVVGPKGWKMQA